MLSGEVRPSYHQCSQSQLSSALTSADRVDVRSQCVLGLPGYAGSDDLLSGALHLHHSRPGPGSRSL